MLLNVGSRFGVGPVRSDSASSQAAVPANTAAATRRLRTRKRIDSPLIQFWGAGGSDGGGAGAAGAGGAASRATTTSTPFMSSWPTPQYSEQKKGKRPASSAVNSTVTALFPRGISLAILNFFSSIPW